MIEFTPSNLKKMNAEIAEVLNAYGFKNVEFSTNGSRFSATEANIKLIANIKGTTSRKQTDLAEYGKRDGVDVNAVGDKGEKLVEYHTRKPKYPYIYVTVRGTRYKCNATQARQRFGTI